MGRQRSSESVGIPHDDDLHPRPEPRPVSGQESHRHDLRSMNSDPTVLSALGDGISDRLGCEMSPDSTDDHWSGHVHAGGCRTSRLRTTRSPFWTELHCDVPQFSDAMQTELARDRIVFAGQGSPVRRRHASLCAPELDTAEGQPPNKALDLTGPA
jgi:hypothetical protein